MSGVHALLRDVRGNVSRSSVISIVLAICMLKFLLYSKGSFIFPESQSHAVFIALNIT